MCTRKQRDCKMLFIEALMLFLYIPESANFLPSCYRSLTFHWPHADVHWWCIYHSEDASRTRRTLFERESGHQLFATVNNAMLREESFEHLTFKFYLFMCHQILPKNVSRVFFRANCKHFHFHKSKLNKHLICWAAKQGGINPILCRSCSSLYLQSLRSR